MVSQRARIQGVTEIFADETKRRRNVTKFVHFMPRAIIITPTHVVAHIEKILAAVPFLQTVSIAEAVSALRKRAAQAFATARRESSRVVDVDCSQDYANCC